MCKLLELQGMGCSRMYMFGRWRMWKQEIRAWLLKKKSSIQKSSVVLQAFRMHKQSY